MRTKSQFSLFSIGFMYALSACGKAPAGHYVSGDKRAYVDIRADGSWLSSDPSQQMTGKYTASDSTIIFSTALGVAQTALFLRDTLKVPSRDNYIVRPGKYWKLSEWDRLKTMNGDLYNIGVYEDLYAADHGGTFFSGAATTAAPLQGFSPSQDVTVIVTAVAGPPPSWSAKATHTQTTKTCDRTNLQLTTKPVTPYPSQEARKVMTCAGGAM